MQKDGKNAPSLLRSTEMLRLIGPENAEIAARVLHAADFKINMTTYDLENLPE